MDLNRLKNPFFSRQRITDLNLFCGRRREIEELYSAVITRQCRSIVGERKMGKSSLLTAIAQPAMMRRFGLDPDRYLVLYLDMEGMSSATRDDFWFEVVDRLSVALPAGWLRQSAGQLLDDNAIRFMAVRRLLRRVRDENLNLALMLDEFEGLASNERFEPDFYGELRSLAGEMGVVYITASKRGLYELTYQHSSTLSSPFFNIFSEMPLGLMPDADARALLQQLSSLGDGSAFCEQEIAKALALAGPHPFFCQIAGHYFYELPNRGQGHSEAVYDQAVRRYDAEAEDHYRYLWAQLSDDEQQALLFPAQAAGSMRKALAIKALLREVDGAWVPFGGAFAEFLDRKREDTQVTPAPLAAASSATDLTGRTLGNYRVLGALGQGGMAKVYKGYQPMLDRYVALKVLAPHFSSDEEFLSRFQREGASIARLRHDNIVQVYDFDVQNDVYYMVMEYIAGDTLKARIRRVREHGERMSRDEILCVLRGVASALDYAHERNIIHRDVKPANIMLRVEEGCTAFSPVLTDFGVAKIFEGAQLTGTGMTIGTPDYMSPEQSSGAPVSASADLYSLSIVLYEMLAGELPFTADTPMAVLLKHIHDDPPSVTLRVADLPPEVDDVLIKALSKRPEQRYPTGAALVRAVEQAWLTVGAEWSESDDRPS
ncbi:MAG: serine/threonine protein kinase [Anaerolineae bacterium]|nr:serine/threonine protein kinase [Anaerolineae bacterium]